MRSQSSSESHTGHDGRRFDDLGVTTPKRWVTRDEIVEQFPISASTLARIPRALLDFGYVGKNAVYDVQDVVSLFERLKGTSLKALIEALEPVRKDESLPEPEASPGRPRKPIAQVQGGRGRPRKPEAVL